ncbi:MAG: hypothetical protein JJU28_10345 [Cyclobacteriaceae bacterium]|nr:hypothetical protein [Cyclobacteriaceae bacterium]
MTLEEEIPLAKVYLREEGNQKYLSTFSNLNLNLFYGRKQFKYENLHLKKLETDHRKLLLPLIFGGISVPFVISAIFLSVGGPYITIPLLFIGIYLFYHGWQGSGVLIIYENNRHDVFFLPFISENIKAYIAYVNHYIQQPNSAYYLYFPPDVLNKPGCMGYTKTQFDSMAANGSVYYEIDPRELGAQIDYVWHPETKSLRPVIKGIANAESIKKQVARQSG